MAVKPAALRGHGGIRRMPDKNDCLRQQKIPQTKQQQQVAPTVNLEKCNNDKNKISDKRNIQLNNSLVDINLDRSMSKSLEEALFYQPIKSRQQQKMDDKSFPAGATCLQDGQMLNSCSNDVDAQSSEDSSILKLGGEISSLNCTSSMNDSSILTSLPSDELKKPTTIVLSSLNVDSPFKGISLKDFESHRKMIEEQNRQKKDMLYKAIEKQ